MNLLKPIVTVDGPDGTGKSLVLEELEKRFQSLDIPYYRHDFPSHGEKSGFLVDEFLGKRILTGTSPSKNKAVYSCYAADRLVWAEEHLDLFDDTESLLLFGRSHLSSFMYQFNTLINKVSLYKETIVDDDYKYPHSLPLTIRKYLEEILHNIECIYNSEIYGSPYAVAGYINIMITHPSFNPISQNVLARIKDKTADVHDANVDLQRRIWQFIDESSKYINMDNIISIDKSYSHKKNVIYPFITEKVNCSLITDRATGDFEYLSPDFIVDKIMRIIKESSFCPESIKRRIL